MAGNPKRRAEMTMLGQHEEQIFDWLDAGRTQSEIAAELGVMRTSITRWLNANEGRKQALADSRALAATHLAEDSLTIADNVRGIDAAEVQAARLKIDARRFLAGVWDRERYGEQRGAAVTVNIGSLHLDALRQAQAALPGAVQAIEHEPAARPLASPYASAEGIVDVQALPVAASGDAFGLM